MDTTVDLSKASLSNMIHALVLADDVGCARRPARALGVWTRRCHDVGAGSPALFPCSQVMQLPREMWIERRCERVAHGLPRCRREERRQRPKKKKAGDEVVDMREGTRAIRQQLLGVGVDARCVRRLERRRYDAVVYIVEDGEETGG